MSIEKNEKQIIEPSREFIRTVENTKMDAHDKVNFLLVKAGLKPAAEIELKISLQTEEDAITYMAEEEIQEALEAIRKSGLFFKIEDRKFTKGEYSLKKAPGIKKISKGESIQTFVAPTQEKLDAIAKVWNTPNEEAIGIALGFPRSAVEAFAEKREILNLNSLPESLDNKEAATFLTPTLSRDNWREEIKEGKRRAAFIKRISPNLYKELMERQSGK